MTCQFVLGLGFHHCVNRNEDAAASTAKSLHSCPTLCDPIDGSPPGSTVPGILQSRVLEWGAIAFSNNQPRQHIKKRDITLPTKVRLVKAMVFPVVLYGCESQAMKESEELMLLNCGVGKDS